jgi:TP901 family phage tail tape measure protein
MAGRFNIDAVFRALDKFSAPVRRMQKTFGSMSKSITTGVDRVNASTKKAIGGLKGLSVAAAAAGLATGLAMKNIIDIGADFEQTIINATAKFPDAVKKGSKEFAELEGLAKHLGATTEFTSSQAAQGINFLAMAGFNAQQTLAALPGLVDLATASSTDLATASDIATDSLGAFNLMAKDATQLAKNLARVNDVMAKTTVTANTDMLQLFEAIKEGGPIAVAAGASIETFSAMAGELANSGIKASVAGTTLKNVFTRLAAPATEGAKALARLGIKTKDSSGNLRDVIDIIGELNEKTRKLGTGDRTQVIEEIFGKIPLAGVNVLLAAGADKLRTYRKTLEGATGAAAEMAKTMRDSTANDIKGLESAWEGVKLSIFDVVKGPFREAVAQLTEWTRAAKAFVDTDFPEKFELGLSVVKNFGDGIKDTFDDVTPVIKGVAEGIDKLFGESSNGPRMTAYIWGRRIATLGIAFVGFSVAVKLASVASFMFGVVSKATTAATWLFEGAVRGVKGAMVLYSLVTRAGVGATIAMSFASKLATADALLNAGATKLATLATRARSIALTIGTLATTRYTLAGTRETVATRISAAATWVKHAAIVAKNFVLGLATKIVNLYTVATSRERIVSLGAAAATWAKTAAERAHAFAAGISAAAQTALAVAQGKATGITVAGTAATNAARTSMLAFGAAVGAAAAAVGALYLAWSQNEDLKRTSGGLGFFDIVGEMYSQGTWDPFKVVDKHMDAQAKREFAKKQKQKGAAATGAAGGGPLANTGIAEIDKQLAGYEKLAGASTNLETSTKELTSQLSALEKQLPGVDMQSLGFGVPGGAQSPLGPVDPNAMLSGVSQIDLSGSPQLILPDNFVMPRDDSMEIRIRDDSGRAEVSEKPKSNGTKVSLVSSGSY